jgi:hypothetical protein
VDWRNSDNVYAINIHNITEDMRDIPEDMKLQHRRCENFAGYNVLFVCHMTCFNDYIKVALQLCNFLDMGA